MCANGDCVQMQSQKREVTLSLESRIRRWFLLTVRRFLQVYNILFPVYPLHHHRPFSVRPSAYNPLLFSGA